MNVDAFNVCERTTTSTERLNDKREENTPEFGVVSQEMALPTHILSVEYSSVRVFLLRTSVLVSVCVRVFVHV